MTVRLCFLHEGRDGKLTHLGNVDHISEYITGEAYVFCAPSPSLTQQFEFGAAFAAPQCGEVCNHTTYSLDVHSPRVSFRAHNILIIKSLAPNGWVPDYYPVTIGDGPPRLPVYWTGASVRCSFGRNP